MSLITLKDSITIAHLAAKLEINGAKNAVESILGKISDLSDVSDVQAKQVIENLTERIKRNEIRNKLVLNNTVTPETANKPKAKYKKKEVMVID